MISSSSMTRIEPFWFIPALSLRTLRLPVQRPARRSSRGERKRQREARALTDRAVAGNRAAVLLDDAVGDRQPQAGALADVLRREERIVDARQLLGRNARAGVADLDRRRRLASARVTIVSQPPFGMASRALRNRFRNTCWSLYSMP